MVSETESFGVNFRNELLKSFIIETDKIINVKLYKLNFLASFLLPSLISLSKNSFS